MQAATRDGHLLKLAQKYCARSGQGGRVTTRDGRGASATRSIDHVGTRKQRIQPDLPGVDPGFIACLLADKYPILFLTRAALFLCQHSGSY